MIAFGSVIYREAISYLDEFIDSINNQTYQDFDIIFINDNIDINVVDNYTEKIKNHKVIVVDKSSSQNMPVELRISLLLEAKKREYKLLVLGDSDDTFDKDRIKNIIESYQLYNNYSFYYNDLLLENGTKAMSGMPSRTISDNDILEYNYLGLSNTAINLELFNINWIESLRECTSFVFDWYLFSRILIDGGKGLFIPEAASIYRIYDNNFVGVNKVTDAMIEKELRVKMEHYNLLSKYAEKYKTLYESMIQKRIEYNIPNGLDNTFWWSNIRQNEKGIKK